MLSEKRAGRITGSRVAGVLGISPFNGPDDVMRDMVRQHFGYEQEFKGNVATEWGNANEQIAIDCLSDLSGLKYKANKEFFICEKYPWIGVTPDAFADGGHMAQVKCPYSLRKGGEFKPLAAQEHYYAQVQIEMLCTNKLSQVFYQWSPFGEHHEVVMFSQVYIDSIMPTLKEFHERFLKIIADENLYSEYLEDMPEPETVDFSNNEELLDAYRQYKALTAQADKATKAAKELKEEIEKMLPSKGAKIVIVGDYKATKVTRKGNVNYKKIPELKGVDLESYRNKEIEFWKL